jgi:hypothetical protein
VGGCCRKIIGDVHNLQCEGATLEFLFLRNYHFLRTRVYGYTGKIYETGSDASVDANINVSVGGELTVIASIICSKTRPFWSLLFESIIFDRALPHPFVSTFIDLIAFEFTKGMLLGIADSFRILDESRVDGSCVCWK